MINMHKFSRHGIAACVAAAALTLSLAAPVMAQDVPQVRVDYSALDLSRSADVQLLYRRLKLAAAQVCGAEQVDARNLQVWQRYNRCYRDALERAVNKVDSPSLLALHRAAGMHPSVFVG